MIASYDIDDLVRLGNPAGTSDDGTTSAAFTDISGAATDPTSVTLTVRKPDGTLLSYGYPTGTDGNLTKETTGRFYYDVAIDQNGLWHWRLSGEGAVVTSEEGVLYGRRSAF